jgi:hypothetical protein
MDELVQAFATRMHFDTLRLLRSDVRLYYERKARDSLVGAVGTPQDLVDVFYIRNRLRRWFGTGQEIDRSNRVFPLYSLVGVRTAFTIGSRNRHNELIHFEIMRRCSEQLAKLPFANDSWREEVFAHLADRQDFRAAAKEDTAKREIDERPAARRQWQATRLEQNKKVLEQYLVDDASNPIFEILDRDAVRSAVSNVQELSLQGLRQLNGALTAAIWLGRHELCSR